MHILGPTVRVDGLGQCLAWTNKNHFVLFPSRTAVKLAHPRSFEGSDLVNWSGYTVCERSYDYRDGYLVVLWEWDSNDAILAVYKRPDDPGAEWPKQWHVVLDNDNYVKGFRQVALEHSETVLVLSNRILNRVSRDGVVPEPEPSAADRPETRIASVGGKAIGILKTEGDLKYNLVDLDTGKALVTNVCPDVLVRASDSVVYFVVGPGRDVSRLDVPDA